MIYISYYGNIFNKNVDLENEPLYIINAINNGYNVLIDIQLINDNYYLGGKYIIEFDFFYKYKDYLWCNCLDDITYINLRNNINDIKIINDLNDLEWGYKEEINRNFISVLPELFKNNYEIRELKNKSNFLGICSSYIGWYKQLFEASIYYALTINGRLTCHQENLFPQVIKYLNENKNEWIDIHIAINDFEENTQNYLNDNYMNSPFIATFTCNKYILSDKYIYYHNIPPCVRIKNTISNLYTLKVVLNQVSSFNKYYNYNLVMKYRPDIIADEIPRLNNFLNTQSNTILIPDCHKHGYNGYSINDQIGIGTQDVMYIYLNFFSYIDQYLFKDNILLHPETLLHHHLSVNNINIVYIDYIYPLNDKRNTVIL
jgi:hypothetical protein